MKIGLAVARAGLPSKTHRYYEDIGLVHAGRHRNKYRDYSETDISKPCILRTALSGSSCRDLLNINQQEAPQRLGEIAASQIARVERKIIDLNGLMRLLVGAEKAAHADDRAGTTDNDPDAIT